MPKNVIFLLLVFFSLTLIYAEESRDYNLEVVTFYHNLGEYEIVLNYLDHLEKTDFLSDSLLFLKASSYDKLGEYSKADTILCRIISKSYNNILINKSVNLFKLHIFTYQPYLQIEKTVSCLSLLEDETIRIDLLFLLAEIYESNNLYHEANDVYLSILQETAYQKQKEINMKMASNLILSEEYHKALDLLLPIIAVNDTVLTEKALYFSYVANFSLERFDKALEDLLKIYTEHPQFEEIEDVLIKISDLYFMKSEYILSWYFLEEYKQSSELSNIKELDDKTKRIKEKIFYNSLNHNPFEKLRFDNEQ